MDTCARPWHDPKVQVSPNVCVLETGTVSRGNMGSLHVKNTMRYVAAGPRRQMQCCSATRTLMSARPETLQNFTAADTVEMHGRQPPRQLYAAAQSSASAMVPMVPVGDRPACRPLEATHDSGFGYHNASQRRPPR